MNKKYITVIVWIAFILLNAIILKNVIMRKNVLDSYFRLHVVANSNSIKDQKIKMNVAKTITTKIDEILKKEPTTSKSDVKKIIKDNVKEILLVANASLKNQEAKEVAMLKIGNIYYNEKTKDDMVMDAGIYDSVQIVIGEGKGNNFWSLIYPYSYAGMYKLDSDVIDNNDLHLTDNENNTTLTTLDIISNDNVEYRSGIFEFVKKMWFN